MWNLREFSLKRTCLRRPLALPLGELSPQVTERAFAGTVYPLRLRFAQPPLPKGEASGMQGKEILAHTCQSARERSKKTEAGFLVGSRGFGGKSKSPRSPFLLPAFSFGEAKENAGPQSQICRRVSAFCPFPHIHQTTASPEEAVVLLHTPAMLQLNYKRREPLDEWGRMR